MSATLGMKSVKVRAFGTKTEIPNNALAKLMYYLDCVATVINYDDRTLTDYQNYDELSGEELVAVYQLAKLLNPRLFIDAGIFIVDPKLLHDAGNQFYEIYDETIGVHVNQEIMIGGKSVKVLKIMACNNIWLSTYYYNPIDLIDKLIIDIERRRYQSTIVNTETAIVKEPVIIIPPSLKSEPVTMTCPFCKNLITTRTYSTCNYVACCCFLLFNIFYCCVQICSGKNVLCVDITHTCPNCGRVIGHYNSC